MLLDIQGLRCVAVISVVLFHLWPRYLSAGYLGVDIFFVISGYLMHHILSSKSFDFAAVYTFYFRRVGRIVPEYLLILLLTMLAVVLTYSASELKTVMHELLAAATFTSNTFALPKTGYFDVNNEYPPFLHTWSLAAELQFYLIVPFIFYMYRKFGDVHEWIGTVFVLVMAAVSVTFQVLTSYDPNLSYMSLPSRIWQFMIGFLVNSLHMAADKKLTGYDNLTSVIQPEDSVSKEPIFAATTVTNEAVELPKTESQIARQLAHLNVKNLIAILFLIQLSVPITGYEAVNRIACTLTAAAFIYVRHNSFLENEWMVYMGGISYSVYLIHWPIITLYNYKNVSRENAMTFAAGFLIAQSCILLSVLVEDWFQRLRAITTTFLRLLVVIVGLYAALIVVFALSPRVPPPASLVDISLDNYDEFITYSMREFDNRQNLRLTRDELIELNEKISDFSFYFSKNNRLHNRTMTTRPKVLHQVEGTGELEILITGNSVAGDLYFGVWGRLKHRFRRLTLYFATGITPFFKDEDGNHAADFVDFIANFDRPIDVVVFRYTHNRVRGNHKYVENMMRMDAQNLFQKVSNLSPKQIIIATAEYEANFSHQKFAKSLQSKADNMTFDEFNFSLKEIEQRNLELDKATMGIDCEKCHFVDLYRRLCDPTEDKCMAVDKHGFANYKDGHHSTMFGSFHFAHELILFMSRLGIL
ncbi:unnamed protein product [Bursaphelenchus xylophilus]|uniref:(pine wood nematode) hypothetical protein n=1 Tax=Bursaphelenchus xylophilus TaxID=6326 RepID=A0A1I7RQB5_BURXY|nr:unnamed protein product [Bursaphelenchus xylophilus]CAG9104309.1 unnamed protein product [Bursaphelenchus xylophilus]